MRIIKDDTTETETEQVLRADDKKENVVRFREDESPKKSREVKPQEIKKWKKEESEEKAAKENDESETDEKTSYYYYYYFTTYMYSLNTGLIFPALDDILQSKDSCIFVHAV